MTLSDDTGGVAVTKIYWRLPLERSDDLRLLSLIVDVT